MLNKSTNKLIKRIVITLLMNGIIAGCLFLLYIVLHIFFYDTYPINTRSMMPTILPGDRIVVNKLIFGARLYKNLDFMYGGELKTIRLRGVRGIIYNDVVVFNRSHPLAFNINEVYVKRCIGLPGDTIWIRNGTYKNSTIDDDVIQKHFSRDPSALFLDSSMFQCFPYSEVLNWNMIDFGPLYLPRKGDCIKLFPTNAWLYKRIIEYENGANVKYTQEGVFLYGQPIHSYTFKDNYYFMAGDNYFHSTDSRYFGPIPETFIIGVVPFKINNKYRWERL